MNRPSARRTAARSGLFVRSGLIAALWLTLAPPSYAALCPGDCANDGGVSVDELLEGVNIALGSRSVQDCPLFDWNDDETVTVEEIVAAVNVALAGCENDPPALRSLPIHRTYPGNSIAVPIEASDPEGRHLQYAATALPPGAVIDRETGLIAWTPAPDQLGPSYLRFRVIDTGEPQAAVDGVLAVKVSPPDACVVPDCDPARGCADMPIPLESECCTEEPRERAAEPDAGCPQGLIAFVGRNQQGFGRLQNCDRLRVVSFAQGGLSVRFHVEIRCLNIVGTVTLHARLETTDFVLFDQTQTAALQRREDGYAQQLALIYAVNENVPVDALEGAEAQLSVTLVDSQGVEESRRLRVVLTLDELADLPEPDIEDIPAGEAGCIGCHRPFGATEQREGIEDAHPAHPLTCTDCHGGNPSASTRALAHVSPGAAPPFLKNLASDQLDAVDPAYIRFINPSDLRVASQTCGRSGCHVEHVRNVPMSTMSTFGGHYTLPRYLAGTQGREALVGAVDAHNPDYDPVLAPAGAIESLRALREPAPDADRTTLGAAMEVYLPKSCPTCHLNAFGQNNASGNYRSSGCAACHMPYADDGLSRSADPRVSKSFPPHPIKHQLTTAIPTEQCAHCHFQGGRIGLAYRGIREGGFRPDRTPPHAVPIGTPLHAHDAGYYFTDEDSTNRVDETPPDLHATAGMVCADCHVGGDVHGDGNLYSAERYQVGIQCEDCHGTVRAAIREDPVDGVFKNSKGSPLRRVRRDADDRILLALATEERELPIPQIHSILESGRNPWMNEAMGVNAEGFSHTDKLECYTCHSSCRQTCIGCHVTVDDSRTAKNHTTGAVTQGAIVVGRDSYSIDQFVLGMNHRGKLSPLCNSMSVFVSYIDPTGTLRYRDRVRTSGDGKVGFGWNPFHHHTVSRTPQNCDRCHSVAAEAGRDNTQMLRETYGFGNGLERASDGDGNTYDLSAFLNEAGDLTSDFPHPDTGPVPKDLRERALSIVVVPHPR